MCAFSLLWISCEGFKLNGKIYVLNMKKKRKNKITVTKNLKESLLELKKLIKIIAAPIAIQQIENLASTDERKAIWVLCSGKLTRDQILTKSGISLRTVTTFIELAKTYGLLEEEKEKGGHPKRVIDYVPSKWKKIRRKKEKTPEKQLEPSEEN